MTLRGPTQLHSHQALHYRHGTNIGLGYPFAAIGDMLPGTPYIQDTTFVIHEKAIKTWGYKELALWGIWQLQAIQCVQPTVGPALPCPAVGPASGAPEWFNEKGTVIPVADVRVPCRQARSDWLFLVY